MLDKSIAIVIVLFIMSMISERFITFVKLYFTEGKRLWGLISESENLALRRISPADEKERELRILRMNIILSILIAFVAHANIFDLMAAKTDPYAVLGWQNIEFVPFSQYSFSLVFNTLFVELFGCLLGGLFISLGSKFWHDVLDMLFTVKGLKQKAIEPNTYKMDSTEQLDEWIKMTQSDSVKKVFDDNKEKLLKIDGVVSVGVIIENGKRCIEVAVTKTNILLPALGYQLPNGMMQDVEIVKRLTLGIKTQLKPSDDITNACIPNAFGTSGLFVCFKGDPQRKPLLLTCYHVVKGPKHNWFHFLRESEETIIHPHGSDNVIGELRYGIKNSEIDAALVTLAPGKYVNEVDEGVLKKTRVITTKEEDNVVTVHMKGFIHKSATGKICSIYNHVKKIEYESNLFLDLENLIAIKTSDSKAISERGDSGAVVYDNNLNVIGMIVAGDSDVSYAIPITTIFKQLNIQLL